MHEGSCPCVAVSFDVRGDLRPPDACHCTQYCKQSGHFRASTDISRRDLAVYRIEHLTWCRSSARVQRGFCSDCGAFLFREPVGKDVDGVAMGALDSPTGTRLGVHIYVAEKGDYHEITDGWPQNTH